MSNYYDRDPWNLPDESSSYGGEDDMPGGGPSDPWILKLWLKSNIIFGGLILFYGFAGWLAGILRRMPQASSWLQAQSELFWEISFLVLTMIALLLPCILIAKMLSMPAKEAFPMRRSRPGILLAAIGCCLGASVLGVYLSSLMAALFQNIASVTPTMPDLLPELPDRITLIVRLLSLTFVASIFEELLFRGVIMQALRRYGDVFALVMSSVLFALTHQNMVQAPNAFVAGLVLGYFTFRTGTLIVPIVMHLVNNTFAGLIGIYMQSAASEEIIRMNTIYFIGCIAVGLFGYYYMMGKEGGFFMPQPQWAKVPGLKYLVFIATPLAAIYFIWTVRSIMTFFE